jgi:hypothetical protein
VSLQSIGAGLSTAITLLTDLKEFLQNISENGLLHRKNRPRSFLMKMEYHLESDGKDI